MNGFQHLNIQYFYFKINNLVEIVGPKYHFCPPTPIFPELAHISGEFYNV